MGIDKSLWDNYPSIIINNTRYHYGRESQYGQYLVENAYIAKDYWVFDERQDLEAFLINLPESADRNLRLKMHPDWRDVTPEQREAYMEEDKLKFRAMAREKIASGTAHSYIMDLEGEHGPYTPQKIPKPATQEPPIQCVERQLREDGIPGGLTEAGKLRFLEGEIDWEGVNTGDKRAILSHEVDFSKIRSSAFEFVFQDIRHDKGWSADGSVARELFAEWRGDDAAVNARDHGEATPTQSNVKSRLEKALFGDKRQEVKPEEKTKAKPREKEKEGREL
jgi:hypothetical protein